MGSIIKANFTGLPQLTLQKNCGDSSKIIPPLCNTVSLKREWGVGEIF